MTISHGAPSGYAIRHDVPNSFESADVAQGYEDQLPAMTAVARMAIDLAPPITSESVIHDNACGPGVVTGQILARFRDGGAAGGPPPRIIATDIAPAMVAEAAKKGPSVDARVMDAKVLGGVADASLTHSFTNFLFVRGWDEEDMVTFASEIHRTLRPGATAVKAAWKTHEWHAVVVDALERTRPGAADQMPEQPWKEDIVRDVFIKAGFEPAKVALKTVKYTPRAPLDWDSKVWQQLLAAISSWVTRNMADQEKEAYYKNLRARIEEDERNPTMYEWGAWILTATK